MSSNVDSRDELKTRTLPQMNLSRVSNPLTAPIPRGADSPASIAAKRFAVRGNAITQQRKSLIAKEFGYSETVFIHDAAGPDQPRRIDIYTEQGDEIPFAGHPVSCSKCAIAILLTHHR